VNRLAVLLAVTERRGALNFGTRDVFASVVGGVRVTETAADLAFCLALASSASGEPLPAGLAAIGEVGLSGEVRQVSQLGGRLQEVRRLGLTSVVIPVNTPQLETYGLEVLRVESVTQAAAELGLRSPARRTTRRRAEEHEWDDQPMSQDESLARGLPPRGVNPFVDINRQFNLDD
jgi:DNA repair protein RadA/Sms